MTLARAFRDGSAEALAAIGHPDRTCPDMMSPTLAATVMAALAAAVSPWCALGIPMLLVAVPGLPTLMFLAGQGTYLAWDMGRCWTCLRQGRPRMASRRVIASDGRITEEWPRITATAWAIWAAVIIETTLLWAGAR